MLQIRNDFGHEIVVPETRLLRPVIFASTVASTGPINLSQFFQTQPGIEVSDSLRRRLEIEKYEPISSAPARPYVAFGAKWKSDDRTIRQELPKDHLSSLEDIASFIETQRAGQNGFLMTGEHGKNVFYVACRNKKTLALVARWWGIRGTNLYGWFLDTPDRYRWESDRECYGCTGPLIFCPANAFL